LNLCRFNLSAPRHARSQRLFCIVCRPVRGQDRSREQSGRHFRGRARALSRFQSVTWTRPVGRSGDGAGRDWDRVGHHAGVEAGSARLQRFRHAARADHLRAGRRCL